jgi:hypothetical protein
MKQEILNPKIGPENSLRRGLIALKTQVSVQVLLLSEAVVKIQ